MRIFSLLLLMGAVLVLHTSDFPRTGQADDSIPPVAVEVRRILLVNGNPVVLLTAKDEDSHLLVFIDHFMAQSIQLGMMGHAIERPLTNDLIGILLRRMGARVDRITITDLRDNTYYALISLHMNGSLHEIDARPSDALAIAVRTGAPIFVSRKLLSDKAFPPEPPPGTKPADKGPDAPKHDA